MTTAIQITRILLGLILIIFPLNALFVKAFKPAMPEQAQALMTAFAQSGYLLTFIQGTELLIGLLLVTGYFTPLAILLLLPISVNILLFHLFLAPPVAGPGLLIFLMNIFLLYAHRTSFIHLIQP